MTHKMGFSALQLMNCLEVRLFVSRLNSSSLVTLQKFKTSLSDVFRLNQFTESESYITIDG
jgi:hypothetical protein